MAVKGTQAKENVIRKIAEVFGDNYIGEVDKKYYVWADDGGEKVQIAITLTCPKTAVSSGTAPTAKAEPAVLDFSDDSSTVKPEATISAEEKENIARLMKELGL